MCIEDYALLGDLGSDRVDRTRHAGVIGREEPDERAFSHLGLIHPAQAITDAARGFAARPVATASSSHG
jgi:hypothetical protein